MARAWIGTSGWSYDHWEGVLYPPGLPAARRREVYTAEFDTVELNASFYRWPGQRTFQSWAANLPDGFQMAVKAPRGLTHGARLFAPERWSTRIAADMARLGPRRGPLLVQLDPRQSRDDARLGWFLEHAPPAVRIAVELRHPSWQDDHVWHMLAWHHASYVVVSGAHIPCHLVATSDLVYIRFHGPSHEHLYAGSYSDADLWWWRERIGEWVGQGRDVYAYFNNDGEGNAVRNARTLKHFLGQ